MPGAGRPSFPAPWGAPPSCAASPPEGSIRSACSAPWPPGSSPGRRPRDGSPPSRRRSGIFASAAGSSRASPRRPAAPGNPPPALPSFRAAVDLPMDRATARAAFPVRRLKSDSAMLWLTPQDTCTIALLFRTLIIVGTFGTAPGSVCPNVRDPPQAQTSPVSVTTAQWLWPQAICSTKTPLRATTRRGAISSTSAPCDAWPRRPAWPHV
mmetsp:Transcript_89674/g.254240  ORF Transcript_89674/g.254240 Transcript_89674/m.254240 type:complete len:210 (+) Transcript_89674:593-1222(+)